MKWTERVFEGRLYTTLARRLLVGSMCGGLILGAVNCGSSSSGNDACSTGDQDGVAGGDYTELLSVSDTGFTLGGVDSGSTDPNIAVQNLGNVTLTLTNTGTRPHDMVVECIPTGLPSTCNNPTSCFPSPDDAGAMGGAVTLVPTLQPGASATVKFVTPVVEGEYIFISDSPGDNTQYNSADGGVTGNLVGEFVLM
jgi:hypothetical protein